MSPSSTESRRASMLLALGAAAGPLYLGIGLVQILTRDGFDMRRHALSLLSNGELGWVQVGSFLMNGALVIAGAIGCRRALRARSGGTWGPLLLAVFGLGLIGSGIFSADPAQGFPPGSDEGPGLSRSGLLHFVMGGIAFYALIAACFVFARRFSVEGSSGLAWYSALTGAAFFIAFAGVSSGSTSAVVMLAFYVAIAWIWTWHSVVLVRIRSSIPETGSPT